MLGNVKHVNGQIPTTSEVQNALRTYHLANGYDLRHLSCVKAVYTNNGRTTEDANWRYATNQMLHSALNTMHKSYPNHARLLELYYFSRIRRAEIATQLRVRKWRLNYMKTTAVQYLAKHLQQLEMQVPPD